MNQWDIYSDTVSDQGLNQGLSYQESFDFEIPVSKSDEETIQALESILPTQGWPKSELSEINCLDSESALQLLLPTLAKLNAQNRWITLISPPADINQRLFAHYGIDSSRILLIHPKNAVDDKVTMNKALKNGTSGIVILWSSQLNKRYLAQWRKSVKQGNSTGIIVNMAHEDNSSESIALSFNVDVEENSIFINEIKLFGIHQVQRSVMALPKINLGSILQPNIVEQDIIGH